MYILDTVLHYIFWIPILALPWLLYSWFRFLLKVAKRKENASSVKFPGTPILFFGLPILLTFLFGGIIEMNERERVLAWLSDNGTNVTVTINGTIATNTVQIVTAFKSIHPIPAHHSHPTVAYRIELKGRTNSLTLHAARDSANSQEFWIFSPHYRATSNNEIGRIQTDFFDAGLISL